MNKPSEAEVRKMRDRVYGQKSTDDNWEGCRDRWMHPNAIEWLKSKKENLTPLVST